jgi:copper chaperone CopZ
LGRIAHLLTVIIATLSAAALTAAPLSAAAQATTQTTLQVEGMYCTGCEAAVRSVLAGMDGVSHVEADNDTQTATVDYDPARVTPEQMVDAINTNTYYVASTADGSSTARRGSTPPQDQGSTAVWAILAALAVALATTVLFVRQARRGRSAHSADAGLTPRA